MYIYISTIIYSWGGHKIAGVFQQASHVWIQQAPSPVVDGPPPKMSKKMTGKRRSLSAVEFKSQIFPGDHC